MKDLNWPGLENNGTNKNKAEQDLLEMKLKNTQNDEEKINDLIENVVKI